ncbi:MAG: hypothetical protein DPW18_19060 [Chloroflexi bacterium]|nr:hypothetical protein [Chloroflexota bacterium]
MGSPFSAIPMKSVYAPRACFSITEINVDRQDAKSAKMTQDLLRALQFICEMRFLAQLASLACPACTAVRRSMMQCGRRM